VGGVRTKCLRLGLPKQSTLLITHDSYHTTTGTVPVSYLCQARSSQKQRGGIFCVCIQICKLLFFYTTYLAILCFWWLLAWDRCSQQCSAVPYRTSKVTPSSPSSPPSRPHNPTPKNSRSPRYNTCQRQKTPSSSANTYTLRYSTGTYIPTSQKSLYLESRSYPRFNFTCARVQYRKSSNNC